MELGEQKSPGRNKRTETFAGDCLRKLLPGGASNAWPRTDVLQSLRHVLRSLRGGSQCIAGGTIRTTVDAEHSLENDHSTSAHYDPTAANGSAEAARTDWRPHRASLSRHVGRETPTHGIRPCRRYLAPNRRQPELWQSASNPSAERSFPCQMHRLTHSKPH